MCMKYRTRINLDKQYVTEFWQTCYKIISVERRSWAAFKRGSQLKASPANGENFELRFSRPLFGADVVVITPLPLLPQIAVTAESDCTDEGREDFDEIDRVLGA